jgi:phosphate transport system substrate-binding protein
MLAPGVDPAAVAAADAARRPIARSSTLILEHPRLSAPTARWPVDRAVSQVLLVGLMVVAFGALAIARFTGPAGVAVASPSASLAAVVAPTTRPTPRPTASPSPSPSTSAGPSLAPSPSPTAEPSGNVQAATATPPAGFSQTYVVKKGDNLYGIASHFGTTVAELKRINGLKDNNIRVGQKLKIP